MMTMTAKKARRNLALIWLIAGAILFLIFVVQTFSGKFNNIQSNAWGWFLPNIMPTLLLMVGSLVQEANNGGDPKKLADPFLFRLALGVSIFYFLIIFLVVIGHNFIEQERMTTIELFQTSSLFLGPLQGLTAAAIGAFFIK